MGSIVKSIGKAIKKVGKSIKKIVKKIGPALVVAAAVYTGVALLGAGGMAGGIGSLSPSNFSLGLGKIGSFFGIGAGTTPIGEAGSLGGTVDTGLTVNAAGEAVTGGVGVDALANTFGAGVNPLTSTADAFSGVSAVFLHFLLIFSRKSGQKHDFFRILRLSEKIFSK